MNRSSKPSLSKSPTVTDDAQPVRVSPAFSVTSVKRAVAVVAIEPVGRGGRRVLQPRAAQHQHVEPAVVVVVEEGDAAADDLDDVALGVDAAVDARLRQPGLARHVGEAGVERQAGRLAARHRLDGARRHALREHAPGEHRGGRRTREQRHGRAARHHRAPDQRPLHRAGLPGVAVAGSVATSVLPAGTCSNVCTAPLGQRTSTSRAEASSPRPTSRRLSLADR